LHRAPVLAIVTPVTSWARKGNASALGAAREKERTA
jgi:hypothetical protein